MESFDVGVWGNNRTNHVISGFCKALAMCARKFEVLVQSEDLIPHMYTCCEQSDIACHQREFKRASPWTCLSKEGTLTLYLLVRSGQLAPACVLRFSSNKPGASLSLVASFNFCLAISSCKQFFDQHSANGGSKYMPVLWYSHTFAEIVCNRQRIVAREYSYRESHSCEPHCMTY